MKNDSGRSERPFPVPKEVIDTINSVSWFFMDAFWMIQFPALAQLMILPTVTTGLILLYVEKRRPVFLINLAINCWIWMNTSWMLSDFFQRQELLTGARALFASGVFFILLSIHYSENVKETFSHFRRFRTLRW